MKKILKWVVVGGLSLMVFLVGFGLLLLVLPLPRELPPIRTSGPVVVSNVTVVDVVQAVLRPGHTVVIEEGRIEAVGATDAVNVPEGALQIDGAGRFLIPGLWDMHVHHGWEMSAQLTLPLFVATGVTHVRDMGGFAPTERRLDWASRIRNQSLLGPQIMAYATGIVTSLRDAEEARQLVAGLTTPGEFIKVYNQLLPEPYLALLEAATKQGVSVVGHRPRSVSVVDAARAGHRSFEHARLFLFDGFPGAADLRERYRRQYSGEAASGGSLESTEVRRAMIDEHSLEMFEAMVAAMVESETWFCPTHITRKMDAFADDPDYRNDPRLKYIPAPQRFGWNLDADEMIESDPSQEGRSTFMDFYEKGLELTGQAHRAGVKILAGSDANDTFSFPGFGLHDELAELVKAGLTPAEALRTATANPAEYFGLTRDYGAVAEGMVADLVLLDANPLEDIAHTTSIQAVIQEGNVYTREDLGEVLQYVERNASSLRIAVQQMLSIIRN